MKSIKNIKRQAVKVSKSELVTKEYLKNSPNIPLIVKPKVERLNLISWAINNQEFIKTHLLKHGGILFRDFEIGKVEQFQKFMKAIFGNLLEYSYGSTPRSKVNGKIYTSTEYPPDQIIPLHNEMSYTSNYPMKIAFYCLQPALEGGRTPIADSRRVFQRIKPKIREKFQEKKIMYVRNYSNQLDLPWEKVFQTNNKSQVEQYCHQAGIEFEWKDNNHLKTIEICQAVAKHPQTREMVWFNQAHLFHISNLNSNVRENLLAIFKEEELPRNTYYGDGSPIEDTVLDEIRTIYNEESISFIWEKGDLLLLDNLLLAHGRTSFIGHRKVVVAMSEASN